MDSNNTIAVTAAVNKNLVFENGKNGCLLVDEFLKLLVLTKDRWFSLSKDEQKQVREAYGYKKKIEHKDEASGEMEEVFEFKMGKSLYVLDNEMAAVINFIEYPDNLRDNARLFNDLYGRDFIYDGERAAVYVFQNLEYDPELGTSGCYWLEDVGDSKTHNYFEKFASKMHEALKFLVTPYLTENDEFNKQRSEAILAFKAKIEKRYKAYSGHELDYIIKRFKKIRGGGKLVEFNNVVKTGSLIPCLNGCYDLKTGKFRSTRREDYLTMYAPSRYVPNAKNEYVTKFLNDVTCNRPELERYLAMSIAVGIDQNTNFKGQFTFLGHETNNGKSTFVNALISTLGTSDKNGLAQTLRPEAFSKAFTQGSTLTPDLARIGFARCIFVSEPDKDLKIDAAGLKRLTSPGTQITINAKYVNSYSIEVHFVLYWDTNYEIIPNDPTIYTSDRMKVLPWDFVPKVKDKDMINKLTSDDAKSAWLCWIIEGHKMFVANGNNLDEPDYCKKMVDAQKDLSDRFGDFLSTYYMESGSERKNTKLKDMLDKYNKTYLDENGLSYQMSSTKFKLELINRKYKVERRSNCDHVIGIVEKPEARLTASVKVDAMKSIENALDIMDLTLNVYFEKDEGASISGEQLVKAYNDSFKAVKSFDACATVVEVLKKLPPDISSQVKTIGVDSNWQPIFEIPGFRSVKDDVMAEVKEKYPSLKDNDDISKLMNEADTCDWIADYQQKVKAELEKLAEVYEIEITEEPFCLTDKDVFEQLISEDDTDNWFNDHLQKVKTELADWAKEDATEDEDKKNSFFVDKKKYDKEVEKVCQQTVLNRHNAYIEKLDKQLVEAKKKSVVEKLKSCRESDDMKETLLKVFANIEHCESYLKMMLDAMA